MRYLVDTNVWLERLLDQEKSDIVTFDNDFNLKGIKKNTPEEIIEKQ